MQVQNNGYINYVLVLKGWNQLTTTSHEIDVTAFTISTSKHNQITEFKEDEQI